MFRVVDDEGRRFTTRYGTREHRNASFFLDNAPNIFRIRAEILRHLVHFHVHIFRRYMNVFRLANSFQYQIRFDIDKSRFAIVFTQFFQRVFRLFQVVFKFHVAAFQIQLELFDHLIDAAFHHRIRNIRFRVIDRRFDQFVLEFFAVMVVDIFLHLLTNHCFQFSKRFERACGFRKFIVQFRHFTAFYVQHIDRKFRVFAGEFLHEIFFRELYFDRHFIARFVADELFFKARNEAAGTDFERIGFAFAAVKRFAVDRAFEVDHRQIAVRQFRAFGNGQFGMLFGNGFQLFVDHFIGDFLMFMFDVQFFVVAQFDFRFFDEGGFEFHVLAFFKLFYVDIGAGNRH